MEIGNRKWRMGSGKREMWNRKWGLYFLLSIPYSLFPIPYSLFPIPYSLYLTLHFLFFIPSFGNIQQRTLRLYLVELVALLSISPNSP